MITETEITENKLKSLLWNEKYSNLNTFDFNHYDLLIREIKEKDFATEEDFLAYKKDMLKGVSFGFYHKPKLLIKEDGSAECIDGMVRLLTCRVLGIDPVVELHFSDNSKIEIKNYRLAEVF